MGLGETHKRRGSCRRAGHRERKGKCAVVFKTIQSAPLASKRSSAYGDLRVKAFLNALVAVGT